jgi:uncharacterized protein with PQ loop repeat
MKDLFLYLGTFGTICLALSGLPQAILSIKDGHAKGVAQWTILLWVLGEAAMVAYALYFYRSDYILLLNYVSNFLLVLVIFKYKYLPRKIT